MARGAEPGRRAPEAPATGDRIESPPSLPPPNLALGGTEGSPSGAGEHQPFHLLARNSLRAAEAERYQNAAVGPQLYTFTGRPDYSFMFAGLDLRSHTLVEHAVSRSGHGPARILDIGTCEGDFLIELMDRYGDKVEPLGISAQDQRRRTAPGLERYLAGKSPAERAKWKEFVEQPARIPDECYIVGDAARLLDLPRCTPKSFDLIVSAVTFIHLANPLGALSQAYALLKPGALLAVDRMCLTGLEDHLPELNEHLATHGYEGRFFSTSLGQASAIFRKTRDDLVLPVRLEKSAEGRAVYRLEGVPSRPSATHDEDQTLRSLDLPAAIEERVRKALEGAPPRFWGSERDLQAAGLEGDARARYYDLFIARDFADAKETVDAAEFLQRIGVPRLALHQDLAALGQCRDMAEARSLWLQSLERHRAARFLEASFSAAPLG